MGFEDDEQVLEVKAKPVMLNYSVQLQYPSYLHQKEEIIVNPGDISIPAGTTVKWQFLSKQTDEILLQFNQLLAHANSKDFAHFTYARKFFIADAYTVKLSKDKEIKGELLFKVKGAESFVILSEVSIAREEKGYKVDLYTKIDKDIDIIDALHMERKTEGMRCVNETTKEVVKIPPLTLVHAIEL